MDLIELKTRITSRIQQIESDDRYQSGLKSPASIQINAPLALIQQSFETEHHTLTTILKWIEEDSS